ncbi:Na-translocating system protein MpsC family protein [Paenibacillus agilis]|uniref:DUF2294 family protein n=1 Tax=Paenibacillus agilis TaxID=3020863 RepID=A0A559IXA7_9BACL|nr:Na-translocating system protein MpsC family protein [Paenibacillus agilis]TVX92243.1 DUF2294 family protein [Paenibacillus agilis]
MVNGNDKKNLEIFEQELAKALSKIHKNIMGRGPIYTEVRIVGNSVFTRFETDLIGSEKMLYGYLQENQYTYRYYDYLREQVTPTINRMFVKMNKLLQVAGMEFRVDEHYTFMLITLNNDLRQLVEIGAVQTPPKIEDTAT